MAGVQDLSSLEPVIRKAVVLEDQRDLDTDPALGIEQLGTIGWTSISTASPIPALVSRSFGIFETFCALVVNGCGLRHQRRCRQRSGGAGGLFRDSSRAIDEEAFELSAVVASGSMNSIINALHRFTVHLRACFIACPSLPAAGGSFLLCSLSGLGDHILTSDLESVPKLPLIAALNLDGRSQCGAPIGAAQHQLEPQHRPAQLAWTLTQRGRRTRSMPGHLTDCSDGVGFQNGRDFSPFRIIEKRPSPVNTNPRHAPPTSSDVMAGLVPAIHVFDLTRDLKRACALTSAGMTNQTP